MRATVIGGGSWGTALASVLGNNGHEVVIWSFEQDVAEAIAARRENPKYMPGVQLPQSVTATHDLPRSLAGAELVLAVNPSHVTRPVMRQALPSLPKATPIVTATKGIENDTLLTMHEVLEDVLPPEMHPYLVCLSGPSFAKETMLKMPTAVVVASPWQKIAQKVQRWFSNDYFRVYTSNDVVGVELGGSLKNVCAIAAGISDGMGFGNNTRAAIMTRGLAELVRLAVRKGANPITLSGLAGMGDLVLTCTGELSRNRTVGLALGRGQKSRLSTGVASRAAVDSENPTETARFDSIRAISPRESSASLSHSRANRRIGQRRMPGRRAAPRFRMRTNHGSGASRSRCSDSLSDSPGKQTCASSNASATTQCKLQIPRIAAETKSPSAGTSRATISKGATPTATIKACRIMRPASRRHGISRGPQAPKPMRHRIIAASRA